MKDNSFYTGQQPPKKNFFQRLWAWLIGAAVVTVATVAVVNTITPTPTSGTLYGLNGNISSIPVSFSDTAFLTAIKALHVPLIRIPGGSVVENWNWKTDKPSVSDLQALYKATGADLLFVLNMTTASLQDNIDWLTACTNAGIPIRYAEMDNEVNNMNSDGRKKFKTVQMYVDTCRVWMERIRELFPGIKIGVVGENKGYAPDVRNWMSSVAVINADGYVLHEYPNPNFYVTNGIVDLHKLDSVITDDFATSGFDKIDASKTWITEFSTKNSDKQGQTADINPDQQVIAIKHMMQRFTDAKIPLMCMHNIVGKEGAFDVSKKTITLLPSGQAFQEFISQNVQKSAELGNIPKPLKIGIYPEYIQTRYNVHVGRRVVYASVWNNGSAFTDTILLNVNNNYFHTYATDTAALIQKIVKIYNTLKPILVIVENEELLHGDIRSYCNELASACHGLPWKCSNGGLTLPELSYWYYSKTHDTAFLHYNIFKKDSLLNGQFLSKINNVQYEIDVLKSLPLYAVNLHYYIGNTAQTAGLIRMINYLKNYTGKEVMSNEAGIYATGLLPDVKTVAVQTGMSYLILYSGSSGNALPISKTDFENAIK